MENQNYTAAILVDKSPEEVFNAINNVRGWWSEEIEGGTEKLNDEFSYHYKDVHRCQMKLIEVIPNQKVVWLVLNNHFSFTQDKTEWKGTKVCFEISKQGDKTQLIFTHIGLIPAYECYDICSNAWGSYINGSLRNLIEMGKGQPNPKEDAATPLETVLMFYRLMEHKNGQGIADIITEDISFSGPLWNASGANDFLQGLQRFLQVRKTYKIIKQFADGNDVCMISNVDAQSPNRGSVSWDTADCFEVRNGKIARINLYFDPGVWRKAIAK